MIRCVRLWTGSDDSSHVQIGRLEMIPGRNADLVSTAISVSGSGHQWQLEGSDPWRRMYVVLAKDADVPFVAD